MGRQRPGLLPEIEYQEATALVGAMIAAPRARVWVEHSVNLPHRRFPQRARRP